MNYTQLLEDYAAAWNDHDIETIMSFMADDCVFETGGGVESYGTRYQGFEEVKQRFQQVWQDIPDVHFENGIHFTENNFGCSEWTFVGTRMTSDKEVGDKIEVDGCDIFTFENGKIKSKRSYLKQVQK